MICMSMNSIYEVGKSLGLEKKDIDKVTSIKVEKSNILHADIYKAGTKYGTVSPQSLYKAGTDYGTISPKELYKGGTRYGTISPKDLI